MAHHDKKKKKRLSLIKGAPGPISIAEFKSQMGPESSAVFLTQVGMPKEKKRKKKDKLFSEMVLKSANHKVDTILEVLSALTSDELDLTGDLDEELKKCGAKSSSLIKDKEGVWRRIRGSACFICKEGQIHVGPKVFVGKNIKTLKDDLKRDRKKSGKK